MTDSANTTWQLYELFQALLAAPIYHLLIEVILLLWILRLMFFTKSYNLNEDRVLKLKKSEEDELIAEWTPEPLVKPLTQEEKCNYRIVTGKPGKYLTLNDRKCLNLATYNFLGMSGDPEVEDGAQRSVSKYGVGSCGPRGFYGTIDVHLHLEERIAKFMNVEEAIIYSYGFSTIASALPAYSKRGDVIFADEAVSFANQMAIKASRSHVHWFKHNDVDDLVRLLELQRVEDERNPSKAKSVRRFLVIEGLYTNVGDVAPLKELVALKYKYKVRLFIDETFSFCVLGKHGRGLTEYSGVDIEDVDLICGSMETSLSSCGGFACGKTFIVDHQRLSGQGYCFSASLPPLLAVASDLALQMLQNDPSIFTKLRANCELMHIELAQLKGLVCCSISESPLKVLRLANSTGDYNKDLKMLEKICDESEIQGVAITVARFLNNIEHISQPACIRIAVSTLLTEKDIVNSVQIIRECLDTVLADW